jgi:hypothetical protein
MLLVGGKRRGGCGCDEHRRIELYQLRRKRVESLVLALGGAAVDSNILPVTVSKRMKSL